MGCAKKTRRPYSKTLSARKPLLHPRFLGDFGGCSQKSEVQGTGILGLSLVHPLLRPWEMKKGVGVLAFSVLPALGLPACAGDPVVASRGCAWEDRTIAPGATFKVDCNMCSCGQGGLVACTTLTCVNPTPQGLDAGEKRGAGLDAGLAAACVLPTSLAFGALAGLTDHVDRFILEPSGWLTLTRTWSQASSDAGASMCQLATPACGTPNVVTIATLAADLADAEVRDAFAEAAILFGVDARHWDGTVFSIQRSDGKQILVGDPCGSGTTACRTIPPGIAALVRDLKSLSTWLADAPACMAL